MRFDGTMLHVTRKELHALVTHASTDETRPHMNCVVIDRARRRLCATDGHRVAVLTGDDATPTASDTRFMWGLRLEEASKLAEYPKSYRYEIDVDAKTATVFDKKTNIAAMPIGPDFDSPFPCVDNVIPRDACPPVPTSPTFSFNVHYLAGIALCQEAIENDSEQGYFRAPVSSFDSIMWRAARWTVVISAYKTDEAVRDDKKREEWADVVRGVSRHGTRASKTN